MTNTNTGGVHITTDPNGTGWVNMAGDVILSRHDTKVVAIAAGKRKAKRHGARLTVHRTDGTVISTKNYAPSPLL
jgi:hypothetical protein